MDVWALRIESTDLEVAHRVPSTMRAPMAKPRPLNELPLGLEPT
jgi:hypothetical protein